MTTRRSNIRSTVRVAGLAGATEQIRDAARHGLEEAAGFVFEKSQEQVPVEDGDLKATGKVTMQGDKAAISYGGPYAVYQHELLGLKHLHGGNAKFLERPLVDERDREARIIADAIREVTGGN